MRLRTRLHPRLRPVCSMTGQHHVEFVLLPGRRRFVEECKWCGRVWSVEPSRVP